MTINKCLGDIKTQRGASFRSHKIKPIGNQKRIDGKNRDIIRKGLHKCKNCSVRGGRTNSDRIGINVTGNVNRPKIVRGTASGLKESGDEFSGGWYKSEVRPREVLKKNMVTEDITQISGGGRGRAVVQQIGGAEEGVGDDEESKRGALG